MNEDKKQSHQATKPETSQLVQMRLQQKTLMKLQSLADLAQMANQSEVVSAAIHLTEEIIRTAGKGGKILIESADGKRETLKIKGF